MQAVRHKSVFVPVMGLMFALAWFTLWIWSVSPYSRYLDHGQWTQIGTVMSICEAVPGGEVLLPIVIYIGGWTLMLIAMMLPTTLPLLEIFRRVTDDRRDQAWLITLLIAGYLVTWALFGVAAHLLDYGLRVLAENNLWFTFNAWVFGAAVLAIAGLFQFSSLKHHCLDRCRTPLSFVMRRWNGPNPGWSSFLLGVDHGIFCVGCCWAIMLLMFVVGTASIGWMLALALVMAVEKNTPWGKKVTAPLGILLLAWSVAMVADHVFTA